MREAKEGLTPSLGLGWCLELGGWLLGRERGWGLDLRETAAFCHLSLSIIHVFHQLTPSYECLPLAPPRSFPTPLLPPLCPGRLGCIRGAPILCPPAPRGVQPLAGGGEKWEGRGGGRGWSLNFLVCSVKDCRPALSLHRRPQPSLTATLSDSRTSPLVLPP